MPPTPNIRGRASRIPLRPFAGQRLEDAGQQLEAWKAPRESFWRRRGLSKTSPRELLEASWRLPEPSWRLLESLGGVWGALAVSNCIIDAEGVRKPLDRHLGRSRSALGSSWSALGALKRGRGIQDRLKGRSGGGQGEVREASSAGQGPQGRLARAVY